MTSSGRVHPESAARLTRIGPAGAAIGVGLRAERPQAYADRDAIYRVHQRLHQELPADALRRFVEGLGGDGEVAMADQTDDATAQLLALQQHEEHEREYESCR